MARQYRDLPASIRVETTLEDVREAEPGQGAFCVIARAAKRALGLPLDSDDLSFDGVDTLIYWQGAETREYALDEEAGPYSRDFDYGLPVQPATFSGVLLPKPSQRQAA